MPVFGKIKHDQQSFTNRIFHKNVELSVSASIQDNSSTGLHSVQMVSNSRQYQPTTYLDPLRPEFSDSGSHWSFIRSMFYLSSSYGTNGISDHEFYDSIRYTNPNNKQYTDRYEDKATVYYIPQQYFGEKIKPGSFQIIDSSNKYYAAGSASSQIIVKDDGYGNLYSSNAIHSQSKNSLSSSENYVGNIYYESGIAVITATSSWSGSGTDDSIDYTTMGGRGGTYNIKFNSTQTIYTREWIVKISPKEFNTTLNPTARGYVSGADGSTGFGKLPMDSPYLSPLLSTGSFAPYITSIQLYDKQGEEPIVVGNLPRPVQVRDDMHLVFRIRLDQ